VHPQLKCRFRGRLPYTSIPARIYAHQYFSMAVSLTQVPPLLPIISVVGPTGSGKSSSCDAVARAARSWRVAGRGVVPHIFNVDVMQMLDGLPIGTNKPTAAERATAVHHFVGASVAAQGGGAQAAPTVGAFVRDVVEEVRAARASEWRRGNLLLPILCGGTHYYQLAALVCNAACGEEGTAVDVEPGSSTEVAGAASATVPTASASPPFVEATDAADASDGGAALEELRRLRPDLAARWHPNDTRRIVSCLRRVLAEQAAPPPPTLRRFEADGNNADVAEPAPIVLWVDCMQRDVLYDRINRRVSQMVGAGLLREVATHLQARAVPSGASRLPTDTELRAAAAAGAASASGVESAIGYKELCVAVAEALIASGGVLPPDVEAAALPDVAAALERLRAATRQYAKQQQQWLRRRFSALLPQLGVTFVRLPHDRAADLAVGIVAAAVTAEAAQQSLADAAAPWLVSASGSNGADGPPQLHMCDLCSVSVVGAAQWAAHMASSRHRASVRRQTQAAATPRRRDRAGTVVEVEGAVADTRQADTAAAA
jgi:tRNA dimethylallyltransferase